MCFSLYAIIVNILYRVASLFNHNFEYNLHNVIRDADGCFIIMDVEILNKRVTLINVKGPSSGDKPELLFFL